MGRTAGGEAGSDGGDGLRGESLAPGDALWPAFIAALRTAGLPDDDVGQPGQRFYAFAEGTGFGGYALSDDIVLLRSLVVLEARRGVGVGGSVLSALLDQARQDGAREAWLLTTTAADFFARHGFRVAARASAPAAIAASAQFSSLCPASAVLMCRKPV